MKKYYNTRPIDFTGCHPVIAEHLKRGEAIECRVWDEHGDPQAVGHIIGFMAGGAGKDMTLRYFDEKTMWRHAEPVPIKVKRIMPPERAIPALIAEGWKFNSWGQMDGPAQTILPAMLFRLGTPLNDPDTISWSWPPCIIEEVEDDE